MERTSKEVHTIAFRAGFGTAKELPGRFWYPQKYRNTIPRDAKAKPMRIKLLLFASGFGDNKRATATQTNQNEIKTTKVKPYPPHNGSKTKASVICKAVLRVSWSPFKRISKKTIPIK